MENPIFVKRSGQTLQIYNLHTTRTNDIKFRTIRNRSRLFGRTDSLSLDDGAFYRNLSDGVLMNHLNVFWIIFMSFRPLSLFVCGVRVGGSKRVYKQTGCGSSRYWNCCVDTDATDAKNVLDVQVMGFLIYIRGRMPQTSSHLVDGPVKYKIRFYIFVRWILTGMWIKSFFTIYQEEWFVLRTKRHAFK